MYISRYLQQVFHNIIRIDLRKTSCNTGWLRFLVHFFFGTLIVFSFILIVLMSLGNNMPRPRPETPSRCTINNCKVTCYEAPYFEYYNEDMVIATTEAALKCNQIILKLIKPYFINSTIPTKWLDSYIKTKIRGLYIIGGNLKQISPDSFMSTFGNYLNIIHFEDVRIKTWKSNTLRGLFNLRVLVIKNCELDDVQQNALQAVESTITHTNIQVPHFWDPINITGTADLREIIEVKLSYNSFFNNLNNKTFTKVPSCKVLYLDFCKINFIGAGTFDHFRSLEYLYLNNNLLVTIPIGLFHNIILRPIKISLHVNFWLCDCSRNDLQLLSIEGFLVTDPVCKYPDEVNGVTFLDFYEYCSNKNLLQTMTHHKENTSYLYYSPKIAYVSGSCDIVDYPLNNNNPVLIPDYIQSAVCVANRMNSNILNKTISTHSSKYYIRIFDWITPVFFSEDSKHNLVEIALSVNRDYGLLWYQSSCKNEVFCINSIPNILKLYNVNIQTNYTFCPFNITSGKICVHDCVTYNLTDYEYKTSPWREYRKFIFYVCLSLTCLSGGAICVYAIINRNPTLLRGNKRILLVKHKNIDALILPPEVKLRTNNTADKTRQKFKNDIFIVPQHTLSAQSLLRTLSVRSNESSNASYISALQPTEQQLFEWRFNQTRNSIEETRISDFDNLPWSNIYESISYHSLESLENNEEANK